MHAQDLSSELVSHVVDHLSGARLSDGGLVLGDVIDSLEAESKDAVLSLSNSGLLV
jgi:hypothetical protein